MLCVTLNESMILQPDKLVFQKSGSFLSRVLSFLLCIPDFTEYGPKMTKKIEFVEVLSVKIPFLGKTYKQGMVLPKATKLKVTQKTSHFKGFFGRDHL